MDELPDSACGQGAEVSRTAEKKLARIAAGSTLLCAMIGLHLVLVHTRGAARLPLMSTFALAVLLWAVVVTGYAFHALWSISQHRRHLLQESEKRDSLTGAFTAGHLRKRINQEYEHALKAGQAAPLGYIKISGVEEVNDAYGYTAGNIVLRGLAQVMMQRVPPGGILARLGGQEFAAFMPQTRLREAELALAAVRKAVTQYRLELGGRGAITGLNAVVGLAAYPCDGESSEEIIRAARKKAAQGLPAEQAEAQQGREPAAQC